MEKMIKLGLFVLVIYAKTFPTNMELRIDTIDIVISKPSYTQDKVVYINIFWSMINNSEKAITNVSPTWSGSLQRVDFGVNKSQESCGNSNAIVVSSKDTIYPVDLYPRPTTPAPCQETYKRLKIPSGDTIYGKYESMMFNYRKLKKMIAVGDGCYLILLYDSMFEQDNTFRHRLREKIRIAKALAKVNEIDVGEYNRKVDIYRDLYEIKSLKIESNKYLLSRDWWGRVDKSVSYYNALLNIQSCDRKTLKSAVIIMGLLGAKKDVVHLQTVLNKSEDFGIAEYYAMESILKLDPMLAVQYIIKYIKNNKDTMIPSSNEYLKQAFEDIEEIKRENETSDIKIGISKMFYNLDTLKALVSSDNTYSDSLLSTEKMGVDYLRNITGKRFGYDPDASKEEREAAINRWEEWWENNKDKYLEENTDSTGRKVNIFKERMKY